MHQRGVLLTAILILAAAVTTAPIMLLVGLTVHETYNWGGRFRGGLAGFDKTYVPSVLENVSMGQNRFFEVSCRNERNESTFTVHSFDPEPDESGVVQHDPAKWQTLTVVSRSTIHSGSPAYVVGLDQLWVVDQWDQVFERDGSRMIERASLPTDAYLKPGFWRDRNSRRVFALDGKLMCITTMPTLERELFQLVDDEWQSLGEIKLLDSSQCWQSDELIELLGPEIQKGRRQFLSKGAGAILRNLNRRHLSALGEIEIQSIGTNTNLFWRLPDRILCRRGIELVRSTFSQTGANTRSSSETEVASALEPANATAVADQWTLVADNLSEDTQWFRVALDGEPAVVLIDNSNPDYPVAKALRLENGRWVEFAAMTLPFASHALTVGSRDDGAKSYLVTATQLGRTRILTIEPTGFRLMQLDHDNFIRGVDGYIYVAMYLGFSFTMATILAIVASLVMRRDRAQFEFGLRTIELASVWERGLARTFDIVFMLLATGIALFALNYALRPDWKTFIEAMHHFDQKTGVRRPIWDHPSMACPLGIVAACITIVFFYIVATIVLQGRFGHTPGKWVFGLRTIRTTLRPCGFAQSLFRELMLSIDCLNFICWTPGILCIALSHNRQRIGDCLAGTLVVRRRSLTSQTKR